MTLPLNNNTSTTDDNYFVDTINELYNTKIGTTGGTITGDLTVTGLVTPGAIVAPTEAVATTNVISAAESGKTFFLNDVDGFASTLPAPAAGLHYKFIVSLAPTEADYTIATADDAAIIQGMVHSVPEDDAGLAAINEKLITFVVDVALAGDYVELISDGTDWFVSGSINVLEALTFTAA